MEVKLGEERKMKCCVDVTRQCVGKGCMGFMPCRITEFKRVPFDQVDAHHADGWRDREENNDEGALMSKFFPGGKCGRIYGESHKH